MENRTYLWLPAILGICTAAIHLFFRFHVRRQLSPLSALASNSQPSKTLLNDEEISSSAIDEVKSDDKTRALPSELPDSIVVSGNAIDIDGGDWVRRLNGFVAQERHNGRYNVVTINTELDYYLSVGECVEEWHTKWNDGRGKSRVYRTVVFDQGELVNFGDDGWINWAFSGKYVRSGLTSLSFRPCC
ncbi:hypothetical protein B0I35DRAFT_426594 [Stachybotrys elegans]|uniref:Uncharacterized protein n=1 Tax=Stachybotrys elegans TaxID=80388 RepID=A0A8K0WU68_9HYPO|nr:hypothetical protein B0I35DRAFT_426594 [Stachybotrys elegans]